MTELAKRICTCCKENKPVSEFYKKTPTSKNDIPYQCYCKKCAYLKNTKVKNKGKNKRYKELKKEGLKHCSDCKQIKSISNFKVPICKSCANIRKNYNYINDDIIEIYDLQRQIKNLSFIEFENQQFKTKMQFGKYLFEKYKIPVLRTTHRISKSNATPQECLLSKKEFLFLKNPRKKSFKCTDDKGNVLFFDTKNSMMKSLKIGSDTIIKYFKNIKSQNCYDFYKNKLTYKIEQL